MPEKERPEPKDIFDDFDTNLFTHPPNIRSGKEIPEGSRARAGTGNYQGRTISSLSGWAVSVLSNTLRLDRYI